MLLSFTLIMILEHPHVKQRLERTISCVEFSKEITCTQNHGYRILDEISEVLGDRSFVTAEDVEQLIYLEQVQHISAFW